MLFLQVFRAVRRRLVIEARKKLPRFSEVRISLFSRFQRLPGLVHLTGFHVRFAEGVQGLRIVALQGDSLLVLGNGGIVLLPEKSYITPSL